MIILHQGERVGTSSIQRTHEVIRFRSEKPPAITGLPSISHDNMRLKLTTVASQTTVPPGYQFHLGMMTLMAIIWLMLVNGMEH